MKTKYYGNWTNKETDKHTQIKYAHDINNNQKDKLNLKDLHTDTVLKIRLNEKLLITVITNIILIKYRKEWETNVDTWLMTIKKFLTSDVSPYRLNWTFKVHHANLFLNPW